MQKTWLGIAITPEFVSFPITGAEALPGSGPELLGPALSTAPGPVGLRSRTSGFGVVFGNEKHLDRFCLRSPVWPLMRSQ